MEKQVLDTAPSCCCRRVHHYHRISRCPTNLTPLPKSTLVLNLSPPPESLAIPKISRCPRVWPCCRNRRRPQICHPQIRRPQIRRSRVCRSFSFYSVPCFNFPRPAGPAATSGPPSRKHTKSTSVVRIPRFGTTWSNSSPAILVVRNLQPYRSDDASNFKEHC